MGRCSAHLTPATGPLFAKPMPLAEGERNPGRDAPGVQGGGGGRGGIVAGGGGSRAVWLARNAVDETQLSPRHCEEPLRRSNPAHDARRFKFQTARPDNVIASVGEAILGAAKEEELDCFVARAPRNDDVARAVAATPRPTWARGRELRPGQPAEWPAPPSNPKYRKQPHAQ